MNDDNKQVRHIIAVVLLSLVIGFLIAMILFGID